MVETITALAFLGFLGSFIWLIIATFKKKPKKTPLIAMIASFAIMIIAVPRPESPAPHQSISPSQKAKQSNASRSSTTPCSKDLIDRVADGLILYYLDHRIYDPVICSRKKINENWFIFCHPPGANIGGLYLVRCEESKNYTIYTVNGKAKTHARRGLPAVPIYEPELQKMVGLGTFEIMKKFK